MKIELKVKSNGHNVCNKMVRKQLIGEQMLYYLQRYKLPININVSQIKSSQQGSTNELHKKTSIDKQNNLNEEQEDYDVSVLSQQVILFQSDRQIEDYIATEKLLAHDTEMKLTKLCKALILVANEEFRKKRQFLSMSSLCDKMEEKNITKEQLNDIEEKCMQTLNLVQAERKKMDLCVVCWEHISTVILVPCMHLVMCNKCPKLKVCPVCKTTVQSSANVFK